MSSDSPASCHRNIGRAAREISFKKSFNVPARVSFQFRKRRARQNHRMPRVPVKFRLADCLGVARNEIPAIAAACPDRKCGWSPSAMAQLEISFRQPAQFAAQTIELNIPRSGCGFSMRSFAGKSSRSNSANSAASSGRWTMAIWRAPSSRHCRRIAPMTVVSRHGSSNFGRPIRDDAPAPRMMTPNSGIFLRRSWKFYHSIWRGTSWTAAAPCRFRLACCLMKNARGLAQSKT